MQPAAQIYETDSNSETSGPNRHFNPSTGMHQGKHYEH
jgi:hypothetical protein